MLLYDDKKSNGLSENSYENIKVELKEEEEYMKKKILISQLLIFILLIQLCLPVFAMQIFVRKQDSTNITLDVDPTDTIQNVKGIIEVELAIPPNQQRLSFANKQLEENRTLADYNIQKDNIINLIVGITLKPTTWTTNVNGSSENWTLEEGNILDLTDVLLPIDAGNKKIIINGHNAAIIGLNTKTFEKLSIEISGGANVTIADLKIDNTSGGKSPIFATDNDLGNKLILFGNNWVKGELYNAGVHVGAGTALTITGTLSDSLTAIGRDIGAGIGGSGAIVDVVGEAGGQITISGGTIIASSDNGGAGIGGCGGSGIGGIGGASGTITINGGHITATGGNGGAGIGGGGGTNSGGAAVTIAISTATVFATGGFGGAGIGGGGGNIAGGAGGTISILSGNITALGGGESSGIGGGGSFTTVGTGAILNIDASAIVKAVSTTNNTATQPAISVVGGTIDSKIMMLNYAALQAANTSTQVYLKASNDLIDSFAPTISYESIAFTVTDNDTYAIKSNAVSQKHNIGPSIDFVINANGLNIFNAVEDGTDLINVPLIPDDEESTASSVNSNPRNKDLTILVNGNVVNMGTIVDTKVAGKTVTTVTIDEQKLEQKLVLEGNNATVSISVTSDAEIQIGELNGQMIKNMETKQAIVEIKTKSATYILPAQEINIDAVSAELGSNVILKDIKVNIEIIKTSEETTKLVENAAVLGEFTMVAQPLTFNVSCTYGDKTIDITKFNNYVERSIAIPDGVDPNKITTGVVIDPDGTVRHVPTKVIIINGKYFAKINSLTNSIYSVIWNPIEFADVENHWAKEAVNDMASRMVLSGIGNDMYAPKREITRAEFAAIMVTGLGLKPGTGDTHFSDVNASDWYAPYVETAFAYGILSGYDSEHFGPMDLITREQAMTMVATAMKITGLKIEIKTDEVDKLLSTFSDTKQSSTWSKESIAVCLKADIVSGKSALILAPKDKITRAEVAVIIRNLLQNSNLI